MSRVRRRPDAPFGGIGWSRWRSRFHVVVVVQGTKVFLCRPQAFTNVTRPIHDAIPKRFMCLRCLYAGGAAK